MLLLFEAGSSVPHIKRFTFRIKCLYSFFKYVLHKSVEAEICRKFKTVLRILWGSNSSQHQKFFCILA